MHSPACYCEPGMAELLDLARQAMDKARLFGTSALGDFEQQRQESMDWSDPVAAIIRGLSSPVGGGAPSIEQSVSTGLGSVGVPGGQDKGLWIPGTPLGDISLGPREGLGLIAGLAMPGGPGGKAEGAASKAGQNIAKSVAKSVPRIVERMGPGGQRLAEAAAARAASKAEPVVEQTLEKAVPKVEQAAAGEVPPGHTRLYRGERAPGTQTPGDETSGRWFTDNPDYAAEFAASHGEDDAPSRVRAIDVPTDVAKQYFLAGTGENGVIPQYLLPRELADQPGTVHARYDRPTPVDAFDLFDTEPPKVEAKGITKAEAARQNAEFRDRYRAENPPRGDTGTTGDVYRTNVGRTTPEELVDALYGPEVGMDAASLQPNVAPATRLADTPAKQSIEGSKRALAKTKYESGLEEVTSLVENNQDPTLPAGYTAPSFEGVLPEEAMLAGDKRSAWRPVLAQRADAEGNPISLKGGATLTPADVEEWQNEIGQPRSGSREASGLEGARYARMNDARAEQFYQDMLDEAGGNPLRSHAYRDYLHNMAYGSQSKRGKGGDVIWKRDAQGQVVTDDKGVKQPARVYESFVKRVNDAGYEYRPQQEGRVEWPWINAPEGTQGPGWEHTPQGRKFLAREVLASLKKGSKDVEAESQFRGMSDRQIAERIMRDKAQSMANAANPDNPLSVTSRRSDVLKAGKMDAATDFSDAEGLASEGTPARGLTDLSGQSIQQEDLAHSFQGNDPFQPEARSRQLDEISRDESSRGGYEFADDETQQRFYKLRGENSRLNDFLQDKAKRKNTTPDDERRIQAALDKVHANEAEMADMLDVSSVHAEERAGGMDTPSTTDPTYPVDTRDVFPQRRPGRFLPGHSVTVGKDGTSVNDAVTGTIWQGKELPPGVEGPVARREFTSTFGTQMPSIGLQTKRVNPKTGKLEDPRMIDEKLKRDFLEGADLPETARVKAAKLLETPPQGKTLPDYVKEGKTAVSPDFTSDPALKAEREARPQIEPTKPGYNPFSSKELNDFVENYLKSVGEQVHGPPSPSREARYGRATSTPPDELTQLLRQQRTSGPQGSAAPMIPNIIWRLMGLAA